MKKNQLGKWECISTPESVHKLYMRNDIETVIDQLINLKKPNGNLSDWINLDEYSKVLEDCGFTVNLYMALLEYGSSHGITLSFNITNVSESEETFINYCMNVLPSIINSIDDELVFKSTDAYKKGVFDLTFFLGSVSPRLYDDSALEIKANLVQVLNSIFNDEHLSKVSNRRMAA